MQNKKKTKTFNWKKFKNQKQANLTQRSVL